MRFKDLIAKHEWEEVSSRLRALYFNEKQLGHHYTHNNALVDTMEKMDAFANDSLLGYKEMFLQLKVKRARSKDKKPWKIFCKYYDVDFFTGKPEENPYWNISGENGDLMRDDKHFKRWYEEKEKNGELTEKDKADSNQTISYALEFSPWSSWLAMEVDEESLAKCGEVDFIAHCLWEMTFFGYEEKEIEKTWKKISKRGKKAIKEVEEGKDLGGTDWEELKAKIADEKS